MSYLGRFRKNVTLTEHSVPKEVSKDMIKYTKEAIREKLFEMKDEAYRDFHSKLMPTVDKNRIIGVRTPALRTFAKEVYKSSDYGKFFKDLPHLYYEENNLH